MLEKQEKTTQIFEFDLEKDLKTNPEKAKEILADVDNKLQGLKKEVRQGCSQEDYEAYNKLIQGYSALERVLSKLTKK